MSNENNNNSAAGGIGFVGLLQVAFIVLKLCGVIDWSWWWVTAPTWISFVIGLFLSIIVAVGIIIRVMRR